MRMATVRMSTRSAIDDLKVGEIAQEADAASSCRDLVNPHRNLEELQRGRRLVDPDDGTGEAENARSGRPGCRAGGPRREHR